MIKFTLNITFFSFSFSPPIFSNFLHHRFIYDMKAIVESTAITMKLAKTVLAGDVLLNNLPKSSPDTDSRCNGNSVGSVTVSHGNWFGFNESNSTVSVIPEWCWRRSSMWFDGNPSSLWSNAGCTWRELDCVSKWIWYRGSFNALSLITWCVCSNVHVMRSNECFKSLFFVWLCNSKIQRKRHSQMKRFSVK